MRITVRRMARSEALTSRIRADADKLCKLYPRIVNCHVVVEQLDRHKQHGWTFSIKIVLRVPGGEIAVTHDHDEDVHVAVRDAFATATRRLEDHIRQRRGEIKAHSLPAAGKAVELDEE